MPRCIMIADDLTGANGAGVLLKKQGLRVLTLLDLDNAQPETISRFDVIIHPTDSRNCDRKEAYRRVIRAASALKNEETMLYAKRIDSTFRGNIGAEVDAMLDILSAGTVALVVPAFPSAGRTCKNGCIFVNGLPLNRTDAGRDAKAPVAASSAVEMLKEQTSSAVEALDINCVRAGSERIANTIRQGASKGARMFLADAENEEDIAKMAEGAVLSGLAFITADPGPFTAAVLGKITAKMDEPSEGRILLAIGSITNSTREQAEYLLQNEQVIAAELDVEKLLMGEESYRAEVTSALRGLSDNKDNYRCLGVLLSSLQPEKRIDFAREAQRLGCTPEEVSQTVNDALAGVSLRLLEENPDIEGIYSSGGDVTTALCHKLGATGLELTEEVIPLAAYGTIVGGKRPGICIVTKGGIVGDRTAAAVCIEYLKKHI